MGQAEKCQLGSRIDYGKVRKEAVYLRRGSSTATAKPDEIARMGTADVDWVGQPSVELYLVDRSTGANLGDHVSIDHGTWYNIPISEEIPDYRPHSGFRMGNVEFMTNDLHVNVNFLREVAVYLHAEAYFPVSLEVRNTAGTVIRDVILEIKLNDPEGRYELLTSQNRPHKPSSSMLEFAHNFRSIFEKDDVFVGKEGETWKVKCIFGKIQPGATLRLQDDLLISCRDAKDTEIIGMIYADNISNPIPIRINLSFQIGSQSLTIEDIEGRASSIARETFSL